jgi:hypothetical protein
MPAAYGNHAVVRRQSLANLVPLPVIPKGTMNENNIRAFTLAMEIQTGFSGCGDGLHS